MTDHLDPDGLRELMHSVLDERARIAEDTHREHHAWVQARIDREQARSQFWFAMAQKTLPGMLVGLLAAAATWAWSVIRTHINWT